MAVPYIYGRMDFQLSINDRPHQCGLAALMAARPPATTRRRLVAPSDLRNTLPATLKRGKPPARCSAWVGPSCHRSIISAGATMRMPGRPAFGCWLACPVTPMPVGQGASHQRFLGLSRRLQGVE